MAYENDILTRNDDNELSVRVVQSTGDNPAVDYDDVYTRDNNGKMAVRVVGLGGSGDSHNLGWYADLTALQTAHPTGVSGDFAILGSTDTVWVWDADTSAWKDTDTKGQVTSVNNQTGDVTVQETLVSGTNIKTVDGNSLLGSGNLELSTYLPLPNGWTTTGTTKALCDDIAADTTATKGKAYLGEVTCSDLPASMVNGEVVVEIMDGTTAANKVIVLTLTSGNTSPYMWRYTYWNGGSNVSGWVSWATAAQGAKADTAVQPGDLATVATTGSYTDLTNTPTIPAAQVNSDWNAVSGVAEILNKPSLATVATTGAYSDLSGTPTIPTVGDGTITITQGGVTKGTFTTNQSGNTTIDVDDAIQVATMPTAGAGEEGKIYQFIGTTDANYTNGYFYKCVSDGQNPATYSWVQTNVQPQGSSLPDTTGHKGYLRLLVDGTINWSDAFPLASNATATAAYSFAGANSITSGTYSIAIGQSASCSSSGSYKIAIGYHASSTAGEAVGIGNGANATASGSYQFGAGTNSTANTLQFRTYQVVSADGTIPHARLTNALQSTSVTIATSDWSSNTASVTVSGLTATSVVWVAPDNASQSAYTTAGVYASSQSADTLTFSCSQTPASSLTINVVYC